jgi:hypothetical protein
VTVTDDDARHLVADLAARGGDLDAVRELLAEVVDEHPADPAGLLVLTLTALAVTFGECLPEPAAALSRPDPEEKRTA